MSVIFSLEGSKVSFNNFDKLACCISLNVFSSTASLTKLIFSALFGLKTTSAISSVPETSSLLIIAFWSNAILSLVSAAFLSIVSKKTLALFPSANPISDLAISLTILSNSNGWFL